ncbi:MAG: phosphoenolpyruvate carboxykinase (ATP) [Anaerolineae bacterium]|nr:phosphoenolpyruvate carboxykinase (ATP) [Anaerolineae bacterium]
MTTASQSVVSEYGLENHGFKNVGAVHWNLSVPALYEHVIRRGEGFMANHGPLIVYNGKHTGRSPNDKFTVKEPSSEGDIWWGKINRPMSPENFAALKQRMLDYCQGRTLYVQDVYVGRDPRYRMPIRVVNELAWQNIFVRNMFVRPDHDALAGHVPEFTLIAMPSFQADAELDKINSETAIVINFATREVLIAASMYGGEIKKSIFTVMNYLLTTKNVLPMHCSANYGPDGDVAIFFGLSGTGKTTLSADSTRTLIGDDEHGWSDHGIFNFEGGCYAKVIKLSPTGEPEIYACTRRWGTVLENVVYDPDTREIDLDDGSVTLNTRASYPIHFIPNADATGMIDKHPRNVVMLTADAFGVMPPISKLTPEEAKYHFLLGYTAKVAGTETGIDEPVATFSPCFGAPFLPMPPKVYGDMLAERIARHKVDVWLVNTGWTGGPYGVGHRMELHYTRAMVHAALNGVLAGAETRTDPIFGVQVPLSCPDVPADVLNPRSTWADPDAYDTQAKKLAAMFDENYAKLDV